MKNTENVSEKVQDALKNEQEARFQLTDDEKSQSILKEQLERIVREFKKGDQLMVVYIPEETDKDKPHSLQVVSAMSRPAAIEAVGTMCSNFFIMPEDIAMAALKGVMRRMQNGEFKEGDNNG